MGIYVPAVGSTAPAQAPGVHTPRAERAGEPAPRQVRSVDAVVVDTLPSRPPADVLDEMAAASQRYDELRSQKRELHFRHDETANRVVVEVRDLEGNVLRTVPPSKALDIIAGGDAE